MGIDRPQTSARASMAGTLQGERNGKIAPADWTDVSVVMNKCRAVEEADGSSHAQATLTNDLSARYV